MSVFFPQKSSGNLKLTRQKLIPLPPGHKPQNRDGSPSEILNFSIDENKSSVPLESFTSEEKSLPIKDTKKKKIGNLVFETIKPKGSAKEEPGITTKVTTYTLNSENQCIKNVYLQMIPTNDNQNIFPEIVDKKFCE